MSGANYLPNVKCPHCNTSCVVSVSGFGSELATRTKECRKCGKEFYVHVLTITSTEEEIVDGRITSMRDRISWLKAQRKKTLAELLIRHEVANKLHRDALDEARSMRDQSRLN